MSWKCPQCGENNLETARMCGLCGEVRPEAKPQEVVVRAMGPASAPEAAGRPAPLPGTTTPPASAPTITSPPVAQGPVFSAPRAESWTQLPPDASPEERRRFAEETAKRIMGEQSRRTQQNVGCGTTVLFIALLPWSLLVLPMPGGLRGRRAMQTLLVIGVAAIVLGVIFGGIALTTVLRALPAIKNGYNVDTGG